LIALSIAAAFGSLVIVVSKIALMVRPKAKAQRLAPAHHRPLKLRE
jgi:hypothetical protein